MFGEIAFVDMVLNTVHLIHAMTCLMLV